MAIATLLGAGVGLVCDITKPTLMGRDGLLEDIKAFVSILFPFFVVALVAAATFERKGLDLFPSGGQVTLARRNEAIRKLTRRQFVCAIFGYCAGVSLAIFLALVFVKITAPLLASSGFLGLPHIKAICVGALAIVFSHMIIITFWGLYYLTDRLHSEDPQQGRMSD